MVKNLVKKSQFAELAGVSAAAITKASATTLKAAFVGKRIDVNHPDAVAYIARRAEASAPETAPGIDSRYEEAVRYCEENNSYTATGIQLGLKISRPRADAIVATMKAAGVYKRKPPEPKAPKKTSGRAAVKEQKKSEPPPKNDGIIYSIPEDITAFADWTLRDLIAKFGTDCRFVDWLKATKEIEAINAARLKNAKTEGTLVSRQLVQSGVIDVFNSALLRVMTDGAKTITAGVIAKHASGATAAEIEPYVSDILGSFFGPIKTKVQRTLRDA